MLYSKPFFKQDSYALFAARIFLCVLTCLFSLLEAHAQTPNTHLEGTVQDQTGAPVANAEVTLKNKASIISENKTDTSGHFELDAAMTQGATLTVRAQGFASFESEIAAIHQSPDELIINLSPA